MCHIRRSVDNVLLRFGRRAILGRLRGSRDVTAGGTGVENFIRYSFGLKVGTPAWEAQKQKFIDSFENAKHILFIEGNLSSFFNFPDSIAFSTELIICLYFGISILF